MNLEIFNSYCQLTGPLDPQAVKLIKEVLTYKNDIEGEKANIFYQMNMAKRFNNRKKYFSCVAALKKLEESEWVCWYNSEQNTFPTGHVNIAKAALSHLGTQYSVVDKRVKPSPDCILPWNSKPFPPRYYQKEAINAAIESGRGVIESAVGTGKSLMAAYIIQKLSVNTVFIVPSRGLSDQIHNDFRDWFGPGKVEIINTAKVRKNSGLKPIRIVTVQTMASLQKTGELGLLMDDVNCICVDEIHHAGSASYTNLLPAIQHVYYRFGFTGTFLRNDSKSLDMWGFLSNVIYKYTAAQAIQDKFLTPLTIKVYRLAGKASKNYQKEYDANYCGNTELLELVHQIHRMEDGDSQFLTLVNKKDKAGKLFHEYLKMNRIDNCYISGDNKKEEISSTIRSFNEKEVKSLIGSSVIGEGIDVRSTDHLLMCQGGKSEIVMVQAIGRAIRLFEGKRMAYVHDFQFENTKYMEKHFHARLEIYKRNFGCEIVYVN